MFMLVMLYACFSELKFEYKYYILILIQIEVDMCYPILEVPWNLIQHVYHIFHHATTIECHDLL